MSQSLPKDPSNLTTVGESSIHEQEASGLSLQHGTDQNRFYGRNSATATQNEMAGTNKRTRSSLDEDEPEFQRAIHASIMANQDRQHYGRSTFETDPSDQMPRTADSFADGLVSMCSDNQQSELDRAIHLSILSAIDYAQSQDDRRADSLIDRGVEWMISHDEDQELQPAIHISLLSDTEGADPPVDEKMLVISSIPATTISTRTPGINQSTVSSPLDDDTLHAIQLSIMDACSNECDQVNNPLAGVAAGQFASTEDTSDPLSSSSPLDEDMQKAIEFSLSNAHHEKGGSPIGSTGAVSREASDQDGGSDSIVVKSHPPQLRLELAERRTWQSSNQAGLDAEKKFPLDPDSDEYKLVLGEVDRTLANRTVDSIDRIENGPLHESYSLCKANIRRSIGRDYAEEQMVKLLFHGTSAGSVDSIVNADTIGFQPLLAGTSTGAIYGDGTYFGRDASYSDIFAGVLPTGQKCLIAAYVVVGRWAPGRSGMKSCPLLPGESFRRYNSLVDNVDNPSMFVIQEPGQAYPAYLITYH